VEEFQAYVEPPHWRASRSIIQLGAKRQNPIGSSRLMASYKVAVVPEMSRVSGIRTSAIAANATPPVGRLI
jgi:hypothetical protein